MIVKRNLYSQREVEERLFGRRNTAKPRKGPKKKSKTKVAPTQVAPTVEPPTVMPEASKKGPRKGSRKNKLSKSTTYNSPKSSASASLLRPSLPRPDYSVNNSGNTKKAVKEIGEAMGKGAKAVGKGAVKTGQAVVKGGGKALRGIGKGGKVAVGLTAGAILYNKLKNSDD